MPTQDGRSIRKFILFYFRSELKYMHRPRAPIRKVFDVEDKTVSDLHDTNLHRRIELFDRLYRTPELHSVC